MFRTAILLAVVALIGACGAIKDPDPEYIHETFTVRAGEAKEIEMVLDEEDLEDDYDDTDYWSWEEDVGDLPPGIDFDTTDVDAEDGSIVVVYEIDVAFWVEPGRYRFHVRYEFWPDDGLFREEFRLDLIVKVRRPRDDDGGPRRLVVEHRLPRVPGADLVIAVAEIEEP